MLLPYLHFPLARPPERTSAAIVVPTRVCGPPLLTGRFTSARAPTSTCHRGSSLGSQNLTTKCPSAGFRGWPEFCHRTSESTVEHRRDNLLHLMRYVCNYRT
jgi:hypothetical protein